MTTGKNPVSNTTAEVNGAYLTLGIMAARLFNLGESAANITAALRRGLDHARNDGVGQEGI